jgi:hypothetical protein
MKDRRVSQTETLRYLLWAYVRLMLATCPSVGVTTSGASSVPRATPSPASAMLTPPAISHSGAYIKVRRRRHPRIGLPSPGSALGDLSGPSVLQVYGSVRRTAHCVPLADLSSSHSTISLILASPVGRTSDLSYLSGRFEETSSNITESSSGITNSRSPTSTSPSEKTNLTLWSKSCMSFSANEFTYHLTCRLPPVALLMKFMCSPCASACVSITTRVQSGPVLPTQCDETPSSRPVGRHAFHTSPAYPFRGGRRRRPGPPH